MTIKDPTGDKPNLPSPVLCNGLPMAHFDSMTNTVLNFGLFPVQIELKSRDNNCSPLVVYVMLYACIQSSFMYTHGYLVNGFREEYRTMSC